MAILQDAMVDRCSMADDWQILWNAYKAVAREFFTDELSNGLLENYSERSFEL